MAYYEFCPFTVPETGERCTLRHHGKSVIHQVEGRNTGIVRAINRQEYEKEPYDLDVIGRRYAKVGQHGTVISVGGGQTSVVPGQASDVVELQDPTPADPEVVKQAEAARAELAAFHEPETKATEPVATAEVEAPKSE